MSLLITNHRLHFIVLYKTKCTKHPLMRRRIKEGKKSPTYVVSNFFSRTTFNNKYFKILFNLCLSLLNSKTDL